MALQEKHNVLITGADHPTGLGTARALSAMNCSITGLYRNDDPCCRSRYWDRLIRYRDHSEVIDILIGLGKKQVRKTVLFMSQDNIVKLVSDHRDILSPYYVFRLPDKPTVDCFLDKTLFHNWALENGFKVPASFICSSHEELDSCLKNVQFPVILKPFEKTEQWDKVSPLHKSFKLDSKEEMGLISFDLFRASSKILIQQWIPGGDRNIYFCLVYYDSNGKKRADFSGRKLFQWPVSCGSTAAAIGSDNKEVSRITGMVFDAVNYKGLGSLEFKFNEKDGQYYLIEPTVGRNDFQSNIALAGGTNLTAFALADALGLNMPEATKRACAWINEEGLLEAIRAYHKEGCLNKRDLVNLLKPHTAFSHFALSDPGPAWHLFKKKAWRKLFA